MSFCCVISVHNSLNNYHLFLISCHIQELCSMLYKLIVFFASRVINLQVNNFSPLHWVVDASQIW